MKKSNYLSKEDQPQPNDARKNGSLVEAYRKRNRKPRVFTRRWSKIHRCWQIFVLGEKFAVHATRKGFFEADAVIKVLNTSERIEDPIFSGDVFLGG